MSSTPTFGSPYDALFRRLPPLHIAMLLVGMDSFTSSLAARPQLRQRWTDETATLSIWQTALADEALRWDSLQSFARQCPRRAAAVAEYLERYFPGDGVDIATTLRDMIKDAEGVSPSLRREAQFPAGSAGGLLTVAPQTGAQAAA